MPLKVNSKVAAIVGGITGVVVVALGFIIAPMISCTDISSGYGPQLFRCPDGIYSYSDIYPYFDMLTPWIVSGILILVVSAYYYKSHNPPR